VRTFNWAIEEVIGTHPDLYLDHCVAMAVALMGSLSLSPYEFTVESTGFRCATIGDEKGFALRVAWSEETALKAMRITRTEQSKPVVERASVAVAALLIGRLIPDGQMRVTREGDRADYWLPRLRCALEVSGTTRVKELTHRHKEKALQVLMNPLRWNGYAIVCCFSSKTGHIRWSYHEQEEGNDE
jgi:hypothetical protein